MESLPINLSIYYKALYVSSQVYLGYIIDFNEVELKPQQIIKIWSVFISSFIKRGFFVDT